MSKPEYANLLRERIINLINDDGRPKGEIAEAAGMSSSQLSQILNGIRRSPSITTIGRLLKALGKSWSDLD